MAKTRARRKSKKTPKAAPPRADGDDKAALELVMKLMAIEGLSCREGQVTKFIVAQLKRAGAKASAIKFDAAHRRTPGGGEVGNLVYKLPGTLRGPRRLLMAHQDTVPICAGSRPVLRGGRVHSADPNTALGADDRAGCAVVLHTAMTILKRRLPHPPLTFFWPVQEEIGLHGARHASLGLLGKPSLAFNWDGGGAAKLTIGATGGYRMAISIAGLASHAGGAPQRGVSAITIAALAVADLQRGGWHGDVRKPAGHGTSNMGTIHGGAATNVVADRVQMTAEARSHDPKFRKRIVSEIEKAFRRAAREVRSVDGATGRVTFDGRLDYESFKLADDEPCILAAEEAVRCVSAVPVRAIANGGLDANWMTARGIPTVSLGCGQMNAHTVDEQLDVEQFRLACRIGLALATEP
ncbi:MAG: M20/M25/M40 family metallo-hydrolase [Planctomycetes bacterium]|nr:M20/M25/M40 family metallo-hydrolase [Planctomycetota bacterium]